MMAAKAMSMALTMTMMTVKTMTMRMTLADLSPHVSRLLQTLSHLHSNKFVASQGVQHTEHDREEESEIGEEVAELKIRLIITLQQFFCGQEVC